MGALNFVFHCVWFLSAQCVYLLHSVWALQLLTWSKPQPCESQNSPVYSRAWLPSTRSQQVGICPLLWHVLVLKFRIVNIFCSLSEGSTEGVTGAFVRPRSSVLKQRSASSRRRWRRSGNSWGWRGEGCSGALLEKGALHPSCCSHVPHRQTAQSKSLAYLLRKSILKG